MTASNPSRASVSATAASFRPTQAENTGASAARLSDNFPITVSAMRVQSPKRTVSPDHYGEFI
jgi:hypothetical protein